MPFTVRRKAGTQHSSDPKSIERPRNAYQYIHTYRHRRTTRQLLPHKPIHGTIDSKSSKNNHYRNHKRHLHPAPFASLLKLQRKHRHLAHKQPRRQNHESKKKSSIKMRSRKPRLTTRNQCSPEYSICRSRQPDEIYMLTLINIKLSQPQGRKSSHDESRKRHYIKPKLRSHEPRIAHMIEQRKQHGRRSQSKRNHISKRIKLHTKPAGLTHGTSRHAIKEIKKGTAQNKQESKDMPMVKSTISSNAAANQIAARKHIWQGKHIISLNTIKKYPQHT